MKILETIYSIFGMVFICLFPVMLAFFNCSRGTCKYFPCNNKELSDEEYEVAILNDIVHGFLYRRREKSWFPLYLRWVLFSPIKAGLCCILTITSLCQVSSVPWYYWLCVAVTYLGSVIWIVNRSIELRRYYPYNVDDSVLDHRKSILAYLVCDAKTGIFVTASADYTNSLVSIYVASTDPDNSISWRLTISMGITLGFLLYQLYCNFQFYRSTRPNNLTKICNDRRMQTYHDDYSQAKKVLEEASQMNDNNNNNNNNNGSGRNVCEKVCYVLVVFFLIWVFIDFIKCYIAYYQLSDHSQRACDDYSNHVVLIGFVCELVTVIVLICLALMVPCNTGKCAWFKLAFVITLAITTISIGSVCISDGGSKYDVYCGPAGYAGGIVMIVVGILFGFCCSLLTLKSMEHQTYSSILNDDENNTKATTNNINTTTNDDKGPLVN